MNIRVQHLAQAHAHALSSRVITRSFTFATRPYPIPFSKQKVNTTRPFLVLSQSPNLLKQFSKNSSSLSTAESTTKDAELKTPMPTPTPTTLGVHKKLAPEYKPGGFLTKGNRAENEYIKYDPHLPDWGPWGISITLKVRSLDGNPRVATFPHLWLRDNCRCAECINQDTMQRAFDTFSIPQNILPETVVTEVEGLKVKWENDGHVSVYKWDWLLKHYENLCNPKPYLQTALNKSSDWIAYWKPSDIASNPPTVDYADIMRNDQGVGKWLEKVQRFGFCYVEGCPISTKATKKLLQRIAFIRETHYGGFYDFTADLTMKDTAYTNLALPAHTDTTYFTDPAGLQMFHLLSHTDGEGGASLLVDGFKAASILKETAPGAYEILSNTPIPAHASGNKGITITPAKKFPVFNFAEQYGSSNLIQIRWNNDDRGVLPLQDDPREMKWYQAAAEWNKILKSEELEYWAQLEPGRPLIFDNWRMLHGRSAFTGKRRICGGYTNHDDYISRLRNTNLTREEVIDLIL